MAEVIRRFRAALEDTQRQFAERTGLTPTSVARHEASQVDRDFPPSPKVIEVFATIARQNKLELFAEIFEGRLKPEDVDLSQQELAAIRRLLRNYADAMKKDPESTKRGRLAIAAFMARDLRTAEQSLRPGLPALVDERIQQTVGEMIRNHDPEVELTPRRRAR
jgi:transcriptional regulator with XRE-family HTH domain